MTQWHEAREHCFCRQCNQERVRQEIGRVHQEHKEENDGMHMVSRTNEPVL